MQYLCTVKPGFTGTRFNGILDLLVYSLFKKMVTSQILGFFDLPVPVDFGISQSYR
jgi:hypothetical protein